MPYGITQCYLPPGRGDIPAFTPAEAGTRFSDPGWMQRWVNLVGCYTPSWYTRPKTVTHPSTNRAQCTVTSFMRRTTLATTPSLRKYSSTITHSRCMIQLSCCSQFRKTYWASISQPLTTVLQSLQRVHRISTYDRISTACEQTASVGGSAGHWVTIRASQFSTQLGFCIGNSSSQRCRLYADTRTVT